MAGSSGKYGYICDGRFPSNRLRCYGNFCPLQFFPNVIHLCRSYDSSVICISVQIQMPFGYILICVYWQTVGCFDLSTSAQQATRIARLPCLFYYNNHNNLLYAVQFKKSLLTNNLTHCRPYMHVIIHIFIAQQILQYILLLYDGLRALNKYSRLLDLMWRLFKRQKSFTGACNGINNFCLIIHLIIRYW